MPIIEHVTPAFYRPYEHSLDFVIMGKNLNALQGANFYLSTDALGIDNPFRTLESTFEGGNILLHRSAPSGFSANVAFAFAELDGVKYYNPNWPWS